MHRRELLPLHPGAEPCLRSGFCCKRRPCGFGEWNDSQTACRHLVGPAPGQYSCAIAEEIMQQPGWEHSPAFGAGCCSSLFNSDRDQLKQQRKEAHA